MSFEAWVLLLGGLLLLTGVSSAWLRRLPFTSTMVYLAVGVALGPLGWDVGFLSPHDDAWVFHRLAEIAVVISPFTLGLKLRLPVRDSRWVPPVVLAFGSMTLTVGLITAIGVYLLQWPLGAAVLLGAVLAPTDPVLASDVQLEHAGDRDELRLALTGEAGFNDGTAFPFVMLGLGLLGLHDLGAGGWRWWTIDVVWAIGGGLGLGAALGYGTGRLLVWVQTRRKEPASVDEYLLLGLIGVTYGLALLLHLYGFLAVFAAGVAVRAMERRSTNLGEAKAQDVLREGAVDPKLAAHPKLAPAYVATTLLNFNEQIERILEAVIVLLVGATFLALELPESAWWFLPALFLLVRPLAVVPVWWTGRFQKREFAGIAWFGVRGIGSIYYVMYAVENGLPQDLADPLVGLTFLTVAVSIVVHGLSVTPGLRLLGRAPS